VKAASITNLSFRVGPVTCEQPVGGACAADDDCPARRRGKFPTT
jgi:hypothetical protein